VAEEQDLLIDATRQAHQRLQESIRRARKSEKWEAREELREYRRRVWLARPFWFVCYCAAWWPVSVAIIEGGRGVSDTGLWNYGLLTTGFLAQCLLMRLIWRPNGDDRAR
jgi:hypothetical protein